MKKQLVRALLCVAMIGMSPAVMGTQVASCSETHVSAASGPVLGCGVGEVSGIIKAADTGLPMSGLTVYQYGYSFRSTVTDGSGHYAFQYQTANGPTSVSTEVPRTGRYTGVSTSLFNVVSGTVSTMNFTLTVGASITGFVSATDVVSPLQHVSVNLIPITPLNGYPSGQQFVSTDATGYYQLHGIAPGGYILYFDTTLGNTFDITLNNYVPAYYGGAVDAASATVISITTPNTTTVNMQLSPGATIAGDVFAADTGAGLVDYAAYVVSADNPGAGANAVRYYGTSSYAVQGLRPGHYRLAVYPWGPAGTKDTQNYIGQFYNNHISATLGDLITITQSTQTVGVSVTLQPGGVITGLVRNASNLHPIAGAGVNLTSDAPGFISANSTFYTGATTDASGVYTATGLPSGHYHASVSYVQGFYDQVYSSTDVISGSVAGKPITVTAPLTVTNVNFSLHPILTGTIAGRVTDGLGQGIAYVNVNINRTDSSTAYGRVYAYTDLNGYYTTTVNTATYFVEFLRNTTSQCGGCYNDQFYGQPAQAAPKVVTVTVGSLMSAINATLQCGQAPPKYFVYFPILLR